MIKRYGKKKACFTRSCQSDLICWVASYLATLQILQLRLRNTRAHISTAVGEGQINQWRITRSLSYLCSGTKNFFYNVFLTLASECNDVLNIISINFFFLYKYTTQSLLNLSYFKVINLNFFKLK